MKFSNTKGVMAVAAISMLLVAGAAAMMVSALDTTTSDSSSDTGTTYDLEVTVGANIEGVGVNLTSAVVDIYTVNFTTEENKTTIVIEKVAENNTDSNGVASFELAEGNYYIVATYQGLTAIGMVDLTEDGSEEVVLHSSHMQEGAMGADQCGAGINYQSFDGTLVQNGTTQNGTGVEGSFSTGGSPQNDGCGPHSKRGPNAMEMIAPTT